MNSRIGRQLARATKTLRPARPDDLRDVASWLRSKEDCQLWAGARVSYPVQLKVLARQIEFKDAESWRVMLVDEIVAFGKLVTKPANRLHIARVISAPNHRRAGLGRLVATHLLERARTREASAISLNVARNNKPAIELYRSLGFDEASRPSDEPLAESLYMEIRD